MLNTIKMIGVNVELKKRLDAIKINSNETYGQVISRIIPGNLKVTKNDGTTIECYFWNFPDTGAEKPFINIYSPKLKKNFLIGLSNIKRIETK